MIPLILHAPAKLNLSLRVLGKREDGFHEIDTLMVNCRDSAISSNFAKPPNFHFNATIPACLVMSKIS